MAWIREHTIHRKTEILQKLVPLKPWWLIVFILLLTAMGVLSVFAYDRPFFLWDITVSGWIKDLLGHGDIPLLNVVSWPWLGIKSVMVATVLVATTWATWVLGWRVGLQVFSVLLIMGINEGFKEIIDRPRPGESESTGGTSFPSGHALYAVLLSGVAWFFVVLKIPKLRLRMSLLGILIAWPILTGLSRIYLEKHWPSDVLGSYILGILVLIVMKWTIPALERTRRPFPKPSTFERKDS